MRVELEKQEGELKRLHHLAYDLEQDLKKLGVKDAEMLAHHLKLKIFNKHKKAKTVLKQLKEVETIQD